MLRPVGACNAPYQVRSKITQLATSFMPPMVHNASLLHPTAYADHDLCVGWAGFFAHHDVYLIQSIFVSRVIFCHIDALFMLERLFWWA